jgi:hypothetical protein
VPAFSRKCQCSVERESASAQWNERVPVLSGTRECQCSVEPESASAQWNMSLVMVICTLLAVQHDHKSCFLASEVWLFAQTNVRRCGGEGDVTCTSLCSFLRAASAITSFLPSSSFSFRSLSLILRRHTHRHATAQGTKYAYVSACYKTCKNDMEQRRCSNKVAALRR